MRTQSQTEFEAELSTMHETKLRMLALAKLLLRDSEGDGEAGALAVELKERAK